jgi:hypothetical protein
VDGFRFADSLFQSKDEPGEEPGQVVEEAAFRFRSNSRGRGGGNVESAPLVFALSKEEKNPRFGVGIFIFRHFHGPLRVVRQAVPTAEMNS